MGTTLTDTHGLIKPDDNEPVDNDQFNENWDKIDANLPRVRSNVIPEGKTPQYFFGYVQTTTGAGGNDRTATPATDANGFGGVWLGYNGIPEFEGIAYARVDDGGAAHQFSAVYVVHEANTTKIKFRAHRQDPEASGAGKWANAYGNIGVFVMIVGW